MSYLLLSELTFPSNNFDVYDRSDVINYYKVISYKRDYTVIIYDQVKYSVKEIIISGRNWIVSFVVDIAMYIFDINNEYQVISSEASFKILFDDKYDEKFLRTFTIKKRKIAMQMQINNNHWTLVMANLDKKTSSVIDPLFFKS